MTTLTFNFIKNGLEVLRGTDDHGEPNVVLIFRNSEGGYKTVEYLGNKVGYFERTADNPFQFHELPNMTLHTFSSGGIDSIKQLLEYLENRK